MATFTTTFYEITRDNGNRHRTPASDNFNEYVTTSAYMHDLIAEYRRKYDRNPSAAWYRKCAKWSKVRNY